MDYQTSIEGIQFFWGVSFTINIVMGIVSFYLVVRKQTPPWATGAFCWIGWWSSATACSLIINAGIGPDNPFAYHQMGVFTESMNNLGICAFVIGFLLKNWNVRGEEALREIEDARRRVALKRLEKEFVNDTE